MGQHNGHMVLAYEMHKKGMSNKDIAEKLGVGLKTAAGYVSKKKQIHTSEKEECDRCEEPTEPKGYWFRQQTLCKKCFLEADSSKCEKLSDIPPAGFQRLESIFDF